jgi:hypothetical protein
MDAQIIDAEKIARPKECANKSSPILQQLYGADTTGKDAPTELGGLSLPIDFVPTSDRDGDAELLQKVERVRARVAKFCLRGGAVRLLYHLHC